MPAPAVASLYVANTDAVWRFSYSSGDTRITAPGVKRNPNGLAWAPETGALGLAWSAGTMLPPLLDTARRGLTTVWRRRVC